MDGEPYIQHDPFPSATTDTLVKNKAKVDIHFVLITIAIVSCLILSSRTSIFSIVVVL